MKKLLKIVLVSSIPVMLFSCYYDEFPPKEEIVIPPGTVVSFADDIAPIFVEYNCTQCHSPSTLGQNPNLTPGNEYNSLVPTYVTAGDRNRRRFYRQLAINGHHNVAADKIALIKKWIEDGAQNN